LPHFPVTDVSRVSLWREDALQVSCTATNASAATVRVLPTNDTTNDAPDATAKTLTLSIIRNTGATTTNFTLADAANDTLTELAAAISAISGWSATLVYTEGEAGGHKSADLVPCGARGASNGDYATLEIADDDTFDYELQADTGILWRSGAWPLGAANVRVEYTAGYATVPEDVQTATAFIAKWMYDQLQHDSMVSGETIGNYSYTVTKETPALNAVTMMLAPYRNRLC
jgi:hypothetical protein